MSVSALIARRRKELGHTQARLAELVGVNIRTIRRWEAGASRPRNSQLFRLATVLGIDLEDFLA